MSKRSFAIILISIGFITLLAWGYFNFIKKPTPADTSTPGENTGTNFVSDFFNTIKNTLSGNDNTEGIDGEKNTNNNQENKDVQTNNGQRARLYMISSMPVAGYTAFTKEQYQFVPDILPGEGGTPVDKPTAPKTESITTLRYVDKTNGNIYQTGMNPVSEKKFSETTIPNVEEAFFGDNGNSVVMRYLKDDNRTIATYAGSLQKEILGGDSVELNKITGSFLPENIKGVSVSPEGDSLFFMYSVKDIMAGITSSMLGLNKTQVFDSPFTEWTPQWPERNMITVTTKPSGYVSGYMYSINPNRRDLTKIMGGIKGLTTLTSPDGKKVLYSNNFMSVKIYNLETNESQDLSIKTLSEKCVWGKNSITVYCAVPKFSESSAVYPDSWYQGEVSFNDNIWKIDTINKSETQLIDPFTQPGENQIDAVNLSVGPNQEYLYFVNNKDFKLWALEL